MIRVDECLQTLDIRGKIFKGPIEATLYEESSQYLEEEEVVKMQKKKKKKEQSKIMAFDIFDILFSNILPVIAHHCFLFKQPTKH